tara:strand:+ start:1003 stop:1467 length:465 start_codon:yes stop_codon:yes gene_type:complete
LRNKRARVPKKKPSKEKRARAFCLSFFLSSSLSRAKAREKSARFVFLPSVTSIKLRVLHSITLYAEATDGGQTSSKGRRHSKRKEKKKEKKKRKKIREIFFLDDGFDDDEDDDDDVVVVVPGDFDARKENTPSCAHGLAHRDSGVFFHDRTRAR